MNKIEILQDLKTWIIVNKPSGLSVHNNEDETNLLQELETQGFKDFSPINRLDKETSGIMILSSDPTVSKNLQTALAQITTSKKYLAIVKGSFLSKKHSGTWTQELTNKAEGRKNPQGLKKDRVKCITHYQVLKTNKYLTLLELTIETGRQHQIRKHCVLHKNQVVGDKRYGEAKFNNLIKEKYNFTDMALHSYDLNFLFKGKKYSVRANPPGSWEKLDV